MLGFDRLLGSFRLEQVLTTSAEDFRFRDRRDSDFRVADLGSPLNTRSCRAQRWDNVSVSRRCMLRTLPDLRPAPVAINRRSQLLQVSLVVLECPGLV